MLQPKISELTLRKLIYLLHDHNDMLTWIQNICEHCTGKKGGILISAIHAYTLHGSPFVKELSKNILTEVCKPWYSTLKMWLLEGKITDPYNEFFIKMKTLNYNLWNNKYLLRKKMLPSFMNPYLTKIILSFGKTMYFLKHVCKDKGQVSQNESLENLLTTTSVDALFDAEKNMKFEESLENIYRKISLYILNLLRNKFRLYDHLELFRKYLLLAQGDFISHLLELLMPELNKDAIDVHFHRLNSLFELAVHSSNAKFEDKEIMDKLTIQIEGRCTGKKGWEVFSLGFKIDDGPIGTIFKETIPVYRVIFNVLWQTKRMEFVLTNMRRKQILIMRLFKSLTYLKFITPNITILTGEMIHFFNQLQYYFMFEILECSWVQLMDKLHKAKSLDDSVIAHNFFLKSLKKEFDALQSELYRASHEENLAFKAFLKTNNYAEDVSLSEEEDKEEIARRANYTLNLLTIKSQMSTLSQRYQSNLEKYLKILSSSANISLQLLSTRINFNNYYNIE
ncbi:gamma-tubulin complex component 3-like [Aethina tumida]|uniref:gamma-tubulin complex component 3-like n=1 Tax=Aethina tumida TaxID=116153 RepID=UPI0021492A47|nr:gamma-tubulin complex component 3-like [Aethina tumida]